MKTVGGVFVLIGLIVILNGCVSSDMYLHKKCDVNKNSIDLIELDYPKVTFLELSAETEKLEIVVVEVDGISHVFSKKTGELLFSRKVVEEVS